MRGHVPLVLPSTFRGAREKRAWTPSPVIRGLPIVIPRRARATTSAVIPGRATWPSVVIPGRAFGAGLRCAIAHRGIHNHEMQLGHDVAPFMFNINIGGYGFRARCYASPRND